jgi:uncharacterized protein YrrD
VQRTSELQGRAIVSADAGAKVGSVSDVLIDERSGRIAGLVVGGAGLFGKERVLPYEEIQVMGPDAIVVKSQQSIVDARTWRERTGSADNGVTERDATRDG